MNFDGGSLSIYPSVLGLCTDSENCQSGGQRSNEISEGRAFKNNRYRFSVNHYRRSGLCRSLNLDDVSVLNDCIETQAGHLGAGDTHALRLYRCLVCRYRVTVIRPMAKYDGEHCGPNRHRDFRAYPTIHTSPCASLLGM